MLKIIRQEIQDALSKNMPFAALVDSLSLLDGLSKVEYPSEQKQGIRYKTFWNKYCRNNNSDLDGETVYAIRNFIMHENIMPIDSKTINCLALTVPNKIGSIYFDTSGVLPDGTIYYRLDLYGFCQRVCNSYDNYYKIHHDRIDDKDKELFVIFENDMKQQDVKGD